MNLKEDRLRWKHDAAAVNKYVDGIVEVLKDEAEAAPVAYMAIDMIFRPYLQWLHSAHTQNLSPRMVRGAVIHLMNMMITEVATRMVREEDGLNYATNWLDEVMELLNDECINDLRQLYSTPPTPDA